MLLMFFTSMIISSALFISSHPVAITALILTQTMVISILIWLSCSISWFSFILFLIFIGGLMVLFIYIVSLASNEKFSITTNMMIFMLILSTLVGVSVMFLNQDINYMTEINSFNHLIYKMYSMKSMPIILLCMNYLLYSLIVVVKMMENYSGPLRSMLNN